MSDWQDISTAPRDGTRIIGYGTTMGELYGGGDDPRIVVMRWHENGVDDYWEVHPTEYYTVMVEPSHWMPLPAPPETKGVTE